MTGLDFPVIPTEGPYFLSRLCGDMWCIVDARGMALKSSRKNSNGMKMWKNKWDAEQVLKALSPRQPRGG